MLTVANSLVEELVEEGEEVLAWCLAIVYRQERIVAKAAPPR
jgi:hypothetical protein